MCTKKVDFKGAIELRITQEADYALRIVALLAARDDFADANTVADAAGITQRFALKILRKLSLGELVVSKKGASGGYRLARPAEEITLKDVIELIDGEIAISKCLAHDHVCSKQGENKRACKIHRIFDAINNDLVEKLEKITIASVI